MLIMIFLNFITVTQNWNAHVQTSTKVPEPRDFKKLNKMCIKEKATDAKANREFRNHHDARIPYGVVNQKHNRMPSSDFIFGKANRPQTPVDTIISNRYGEAAA